VKSPGKLVLDPDELKEAFFAGEPDQDIEIARRVGGSPRIGAEDRDPLGIVSGEYRDDSPRAALVSVRPGILPACIYTGWYDAHPVSVF